MTSLVAMSPSGDHTDGVFGADLPFIVFILNCSGLASLSFDSSLSGCINWLPWDQALKRDLLASNLLRMSF